MSNETTVSDWDAVKPALYEAAKGHWFELDSLFNERDALLAEVGRLREALVNAAIPYEALLADAESRKWIAPEIWTAIEAAVTAARAAIRQGNTDAE